MLGTARNSLWVCMRRARRAPLRRRLATSAPSQAAAAAAGASREGSRLRDQRDHRPANFPDNDKLRDDAVLRQVIDAPIKSGGAPRLRSLFGGGGGSAAASAASAASTTVGGSRNVGLFCNRYLTSAAGFLTYARVSLEKAQRVTDKVLSASSTEEYRGIVKDLDRLSDILCRVLDMVDFVRVTHPDARIQDAASQAWGLVYQYMNELNTTTGLCDQLRRAVEDAEIRAGWTEEEVIVAQMLLLDFTKSAINHPKETRDTFVHLSQQISELGSAFMDQMLPEQTHLSFPSSALAGLDPVVARDFTRRGVVHLPTVGPEASAALRSAHDEEARRKMFLASRTASARSVDLLERLLKARARLAHVSGFDSYAHMALRDRMMARSPESVRRFLEALGRHNEAEAGSNMADLVEAKWRRSRAGGAGAQFHPWDKEYYMASVRSEMLAGQRLSVLSHDDAQLSAYFSLGTVMQGLSRIFDRLYGVRLVHRETLPGETWHPDVIRLDFVSDSEGTVAVMYCDLFHRVDKSPNPAHFTIRCSRTISRREVDEAARELGSGAGGSPDRPVFATAEEAVNDGMSVSSHPPASASAPASAGSLQQLPTIGLVCDFTARASSASTPALLGAHQVETLFHEMGHAAHSVLGRTTLQNVSGTRCATDFAELPSSLMEHFATDPAALGLFARHHATGEKLRDVEAVARSRKVAQRFRGLDTENQILLALLDQEYHSPAVLAASSRGRRFDSTATFHALQRRLGYRPAPDPPGTRWQGFFGHLFGYGGAYYSYLFDQVLAERVWRVVFHDDSNGGVLDRRNGELLRDSLLRWGGSRDPWTCVAEALSKGEDADTLARGDERAMALVGSWGVRDSV